MAGSKGLAPAAGVAAEPLAGDTIAANATAAGPGAINILRISGPRAFEVAASLCPRFDAAAPTRVARLRRVVHPDSGRLLDQALLLHFRAPHSYTGEDLVELQGHGGVALAKATLAAALMAGARVARPGEFSKRAVRAGKLDLAQAEGVAQLIAAKSEAGLRAAGALLDGSFSKRIEAALAQLDLLAGGLEAQLDFPEDLARPPDSALQAWVPESESLIELAAELARLASTHARSRQLQEGARVLLLGAPNAGKSSLLNALCGAPRALVHEQPGTTRDPVEARFELCPPALGSPGGQARADAAPLGILLTLTDSAGLRESDEAVEQAGVARAQALAASADLLIVVEDLQAEEADQAESRTLLRALVSQGLPALPAIDEDLQAAGGGDLGSPAARPRALLVGSKADLSAAPQQQARRALKIQALAAAYPGLGLIETSAHSGEGLGELRARLYESLAGEAAAASSESLQVSLLRHQQALQQAAQALQVAGVLLSEGEGLDAALEELHEARRALASILGRGVVSEELLDQIFSRFCVGK